MTLWDWILYGILVWRENARRQEEKRIIESWKAENEMKLRKLKASLSHSFLEEMLAWVGIIILVPIDVDAINKEIKEVEEMIQNNAALIQHYDSGGPLCACCG